MIKRFLPVILAFVISIFGSWYLFSGLDSNAKEITLESNLFGIQIGVFTDIDNAKKMRDNLGGVVIDDMGIYRVYYAVVSNYNNLNYIEDTLESLGISYYIRMLYVDDKVIEDNEKIETLMVSTKDKEVKMRLKDELLSIYGDVLYERNDA